MTKSDLDMFIKYFSHEKAIEYRHRNNIDTRVKVNDNPALNSTVDYIINGIKDLTNDGYRCFYALVNLTSLSTIEKENLQAKGRLLFYLLGEKLITKVKLEFDLTIGRAKLISNSQLLNSVYHRDSQLRSPFTKTSVIDEIKKVNPDMSKIFINQ
jgi:hypothetical protein